MASRVICISRTIGAGGEEIGRAAAKELRFRYADEEIIIRAAEMAGVSPDTVAQVERTPGLVTRILEAMSRTPPDLEGWSATAMMLTDSASKYEGLIERVVRQTAEDGEVVIVAHGASIPLAGAGGLLRVLITASADLRTERLARAAGLGAAAAKKAVRESDRQRRDYLRRFYDVRQELPTHYDLVINTDVMTVPAAVQLLVTAAQSA